MSALRDDMTLLIAPESLMFGTFVVDDTHRIVSWNAVAERALGYSSASTLGCTCEEMLALLHAEHLPLCPDINDTSVVSEVSDTSNPCCPAAATGSSTSSPSAIDPHALRQHAGAPVEMRVIARNGAIRWLSVSVMRARRLDGSACVLHIFRDITEQTGYRSRGEAAEQIARHPGAVLHLPLGASAADQSDPVMMAPPEHLTPREREALELLAQGMATAEIATALGISRVTARNHVTRVIEKLGVKTRLQAVLAASRLGLI